MLRFLVAGELGTCYFAVAVIIIIIIVAVVVVVVVTIISHRVNTTTPIGTCIAKMLTIRCFEIVALI